MAEGWDEKAVFLAALALPPGDRDAFLEGACPDVASRKRIEALLRHSGPETLPPQRAGEPVSVAGEPQRIDEFRILRKLGQGGMGVVYLAEDTDLGRHVALKLLPHHLASSEAARSRFRDEARNAAALRHPGIVQVHKFGSDGVHQYLVSEFVDGPTLRSVIDDEAERARTLVGTRAIREWYQRCALIISQLADALEYSHRAGVIHRDVKPSNVLLDSERGPRLTDFGIAKHLAEEGKTATADLMGSCHYMSPEQASLAATKVDQRSDIFSLGVVLYEMLAFRRPFEGGDLLEVLRAVIASSPPSLRKLGRHLPRDLETICLKAIEKEPKDRYQTAAHMAADLRCFLAGRPILARPPGPFRRAVLFGRVHRRALVVCLLVSLTGGLLATSLVVRAQRDASLAWLSVSSDSTCRAFLRGHNPDSLAPAGHITDLGATPINSAKVVPGQYRLTLVRADGALCEFNLILIGVGQARARSVHAADTRSPGHPAADLTGVFARPEDVRSAMIQIDGGAFQLARTAASHRSLRAPELIGSFLIDSAEVSNSEYREFVTATGRDEPYHWRTFGYSDAIADLPVIWVSLEDAEAYARWRGKRLPTMLEWQAAARGAEGRLYPGGDDAPPHGEATPVDSGDQRKIFESYARTVRPTREPAPWDVPGRPLHTYSNVREFTATVDMNSLNVLLAGRAWSDPWDHPLPDVITTPVRLPTPRAGFRCAKSLTLPKESP